MKENFDLVLIGKYDGVENGCHSWTALSYAIVIKKNDKRAVCLRDENIEYYYMPYSSKEKESHDYTNVVPGDIRIISIMHDNYDKLEKTRNNMYLYMQESGLYFDDDTKYGNPIKEEKVKQIVMTSTH